MLFVPRATPRCRRRLGLAACSLDFGTLAGTDIAALITLLLSNGNRPLSSSFVI
jgi:hypothetical protein